MNNTIILQQIADTFGFDLEDVEMLMASFLRSSEKSMSSLKRAIDAKDLQGIGDAAHAIKGSASTLTLHDISNIASDMDKCIKENRSMDFQEGYRNLQLLLEELS